MSRNKSLELLAIMLLAGSMGGIVKDIGRSMQSSYNPALDAKNNRKISNLKYARMSYLGKNSSFYQRKTY